MLPTFEDADAPENAADATPLRLSLQRLRDRLAEQELHVAQIFATLRTDVARLVQQLECVPQAVPSPPAASAAPIAADDPWADFRPAGPQSAHRDDQPSFETASARSPSAAPLDLDETVFGPELAGKAALDPERGELLQDMLSGNASAMTLSGAILLFRGATPERMPQLLKDIGEAWYGWRSYTADGPDALRDELSGWLQRKCAEAGVPNVIELVRPGDRYDSKRHHARQPGVEVAEVGGWVVLRDNGKIYTKAAVTVK